MFRTPVLLIVFNRPDTTEQVLKQIKRVKPRHLFVAADGPRPNRPEDFDKCNKVRKLVSDEIDWDCEIKLLIREENLGCAKGVSAAITWFFSQVEEGIILEDDCLPAPDFFEYCSILLQKYKNDDRIMHIAGQNPLTDFKTDEQLIFSKYSFIWGWATWAKAWQKYDLAMQTWANTGTKRKIKSLCLNEQEWKYWKINFDRYFKAGVERANTWDYQWQYALFANNGIAIVPAKSLVNNIGIGHQDATHTKLADSKVEKFVENSLNFTSLDFTIRVNKTFDSMVFNQIFVVWLPRFNTKVFIYENFYKYLPNYIKKFLSGYNRVIR